MAGFPWFSRSRPSLVQSGPGGRNRSHALDKETVSIGRSEEADIVVADPYIAPVHARIERQADDTFVIRRMGLNPIWLRGEPIVQTAIMRAGDSFRLGQDIEFSFVWAKGAEKDAASGAGKKPVKTVPVEGGKERPLLKQPAVLATIGVVYLGLMGAVGIKFLSDDEDTDGAPSPARIKQEAAAIPGCLASAHRLRKYSQVSFNGAVDTRAQSDGAPSRYAALTEAPADEETLAKAAAGIAADYERTAVAAFMAEQRGDRTGATRLYQQAYEIVPDVNCSAGQFALQRRAATREAPEE